jgi:DNA-binding beta-propeller fold protein YncE
MYWPVDVEFSATDQPFVLDWNNHKVRRVNADDTFETVVGTEIPGDGDPMMADLVPPGALGTTDALNHPTDLLFRPDGRLLVCAWHNHKLREWDPTTGLVTVISGRGPGFMGDGGPAAMALLKQPSKFAFDPQGNLYFVDQGNRRIRRIGTDGVIQTIAGTGMPSTGTHLENNGDGGPPAMATFTWQTGENPEPEGAIAIDAAGKLYIADSEGYRIRMIDLVANQITTIAGTGEAGFAGDGGPATAAQINAPRDLEIGPDGDLYIADTNNHCVRAINLTSGIIRTVAGTCGQYGYSGDLGTATAARLYRPFGVAFDHAGNLYVSDTYNNRIRRVQH